MYAASISSAPAYWDTGEAQTVPWIFGIMHPTGFPAFTILAGVFAHLVPFGTVAWRIGLFCAIALTGAAWYTGRIVRLLDGDVWISCASAWLFAFGDVAWTRGTRAEVHALAVFFAIATLYYALRYLRAPDTRTLALGALAFALGIATHPIVALLTPALFVAFTERIRTLSARRVAVVAMALAIGAGFYAYLPLRSAAVTAQRLDPTRALGIAPGRSFWDNDHPSARGGFLREINGSEYGAGGALARIVQPETYRNGIAPYLDTLLDELTPLGVFFAVIGFGVLWRRPDVSGVMALLAFAVPTAFSLAYTVEADPKRYQLIGFAVVAAAAGCGASWFLLQIRTREWVRIALAVGVAAGMLFFNRATFAQRGDAGAQAVIDSVVEKTPRNAIVISSWLYATPLAYAAYVQHAFGKRTLDSAWLSEDAAMVPRWVQTRPVFVVGRIFGSVKGFGLRRVAADPNIYRVVRLLPARPRSSSH